jgi:hypothetical protein
LVLHKPRGAKLTSDRFLVGAFRHGLNLSTIGLGFVLNVLPLVKMLTLGPDRRPVPLGNGMNNGVCKGPFLLMVGRERSADGNTAQRDRRCPASLRLLFDYSQMGHRFRRRELNALIKMFHAPERIHLFESPFESVWIC